jgi:BirA family biotin operon repressor/biotin-[acetyl-CoA-carboxylase] ligase
MLPSLAVVETIRRLLGPETPVGIKWVNDILIEGRKVAGVLTATQLSGPILEHVVFGLGVNVEKKPGIDRSPFVPLAGCLQEEVRDEELTFESVVWTLLEILDGFYRELLEEGPGRLLEAYRSRSLVLGREVIIRDENPDGETPIAQGKVEAIEPDLSLRIQGVSSPVSRGRLLFAEGADESRPSMERG